MNDNGIYDTCEADAQPAVVITTEPKRFDAARICQEGASNPRRIATSLVEAIDECRAEGVNPQFDAACFLILHQLCWVMRAGEPSVSPARYNTACKAVGMPGY